MLPSGKNPVWDKSYALGLAVVKLVRLLQADREYVVSKQLLKSGTSIGANISEALQAQSRKDFVAKLSIAHKEANETDFWLRLIVDAGYVHEKETAASKSLLNQTIALLTAILKKTKQNIQ